MYFINSKKLKAYSVLPACLVFSIMALGLFMSACDTGAGSAPGYTVVFYQGDGGGTPPANVVVAPNTYTQLPEQGSMIPPTGKVLSGWRDPYEEAPFNPLVQYRVTREEVRLTAQWRDQNAGLYTVSFTTGDGSGTSPANIRAVPGNIISLPPQGNMTAPAGKVFDGWRVNGVLYNVNAYYRVTTNNVTIVAQWRDAGSDPGSSTPTVNYTVTFNRNGGSGTAPSAQTVTAGGSITLPGGSGMSYSDHTFVGWSANSSGTGTIYHSGQSFTPTGNTTLYAMWNFNGSSSPSTEIYTVSFNRNGGSGTAPSAQTVTAGGSITLPGQGGMSFSGHSFEGWSTDSSGSGSFYHPSESFTPAHDTTLYAMWYFDGPSTPSLPAAPTGVTASASGTTISISWNAVPGADYYNLYFYVIAPEPEGEYSSHGSSTGTSFSMVVSTNTYVGIGITAVNSAGEGPMSNAVSVHTD